MVDSGQRQCWSLVTFLYLSVRTSLCCKLVGKLGWLQDILAALPWTIIRRVCFQRLTSWHCAHKPSLIIRDNVIGMSPPYTVHLHWPTWMACSEPHDSLYDRYSECSATVPAVLIWLTTFLCRGEWFPINLQFNHWNRCKFASRSPPILLVMCFSGRNNYIVQWWSFLVVDIILGGEPCSCNTWMTLTWLIYHLSHRDYSVTCHVPTI